MNKSDRNENALILILTTDRQIDRRTLQEADSLESAGWRVTILAIPTDAGQADDPRVVRLNAAGSSVRLKNRVILGSYRWLARHLIMNSGVMRLIKHFAWRYIVNQEVFFLDLFSNAVSRYTPKYVVAVDLPMLPVASAVAKRCGAKLIYDSHELYSEQEFSRFEKKRWKKLEDKHIRSCDVVITVNPSIAAELEKRYDITDVKIIYNAEVCHQPLKKQRLFHEKFHLSQERKILLFQGGLFSGRHLEKVILAMRHLQNTKVDLVVLGDGRLRQKLEQLAIAARIDKRVYFHSAVPQNKLLDFTQSADAGLIPYQAICLNNYYCTPNKLFEFIAAGIPILASDFPELQKMIKTHDIGMVGDLSTTEKMAFLIDEFFSDDNRLHYWRDNVLIARNSVCWQSEEKKLLKIFEDA